MKPMYRVEMEEIHKSFGGVDALREVNLKVKPGEIHALVGENGAGKSTLMKILSGAYTRDAGRIYIDGKEVDIRSPYRGKQLGIGIIYQEFALAPDLSVAENIYLSHLKSSRSGFINRKELYAKTTELLESIGFALDPSEPVKRLSVAYQQIVEIGKALSSQVKILILDEPTAVLAPEETKKLFETLRILSSKGVAIIYISHRLEEIFEISDRITVLKDGAVVDSLLPSETEMETIVELMIGRNIDNFFPRRESRIGDVIFEADRISREDLVKEISFQIRAGEVFGIAGLVGSGRTETVRALYGADKRDRGQIRIGGTTVKNRNPKESIAGGIAFVPEDRKRQGAIIPLSIRENILLARNQFSLWGFLRKKQEKKLIDQLFDRLKIKAGGSEAALGSLSGGNQQKVVLAKWFNTDSRVIILDEPTRGVDVGAKVEIYRLINELAESGLGIIMISSEMIELIGMCDRVAVMKQGTIQGVLNKDELSEKNIMVLAI